MESLIDEIDSLVAPDLSTSVPDWCENCQCLRRDMKKLQDEQEQSYVKLKQKIISTDLLIKKYKSKCEDYDVQYKKNEESTKRADKYQRQSEILETQLKAALMETEPLRTTKVSLESDVKMKTLEIEELTNRLVVAEGAQKQYEHLNKSTYADIERLEGEKRELNGKIKVLESGKVTKEAAKELKNEVSSLKKENASLTKRGRQLEKKLQTALSKIEQLNEKLRDNRTGHVERRRTTSGSLLSPVRSPYRSPRMKRVSPNTSPKKGMSKSSHKQPIKVETLGMRESDVCSEESSDEDDIQSVMSFRWTFSPVMPCLSPLPPSPAPSHKSQTQADTSDDDNLSDMADELEQQILGDFVADDNLDDCQEDTPDTRCELKDTTEDFKMKLEAPNVDYSSVDHVYGMEVEADMAALSTTLAKPNSQIKPITSGAKESSTHVSSPDVVKDVGKTSEKNVHCSMLNNENMNESMKSVIVEPSNGSKSVKEKIAASIEIMSPTKTNTRKRGSQHINRTVSSDNSSHNITSITSNTGSEAGVTVKVHPLSCEPNTGLNTVNETESDKAHTTNSKSHLPVQGTSTLNNPDHYAQSVHPENTLVQDNKKYINEATESLPRTDTLEFDPVTTEECEIENTGIDIGNDNLLQTPFVSGNCNSDSEKHTCKPENENSTSQISYMNEDNNMVREVEIKLNVDIDISATGMGNNVRPKHRNSAKDTNDKEGELNKEVEGIVRVDIKEETEPVRRLQKTPPLRGCLKRQFSVDHRQADTLVEKVNSEIEPAKISLKSKFTFQKFQKASYGTLEDEINDMQGNSDEYTVLTRETPTRTNGNVQTKRLKTIKRKLRSSCKFKDLDSAVVRSSQDTLEQEEIAMAFTNKHRDSLDKHTCDDVLKRRDEICDASHVDLLHTRDTVTNNVPHSEISNSSGDKHCSTGTRLIDSSKDTDLNEDLNKDKVNVLVEPAIIENDEKVLSSNLEPTIRENNEKVLSNNLFIDSFTRNKSGDSEMSDTEYVKLDVHLVTCHGDSNVDEGVVQTENTSKLDVHLVTCHGDSNVDEGVVQTENTSKLDVHLVTCHGDSNVDDGVVQTENTSKLDVHLETCHGDSNVDEGVVQTKNTSKLIVSASRQMSTGFIVNQPSVERAPSLEHNMGTKLFVKGTCDTLKHRTGTLPNLQQAQRNSCETICEESSLDVEMNNEEPNKVNTLLRQSDAASFGKQDNVIFGVNDLLCGEPEDSDENIKDKISSLGISQEQKEIRTSRDTKDELSSLVTDSCRDESDNFPLTASSLPNLSNKHSTQISSHLSSSTNVSPKPGEHDSVSKSSMDCTEVPGCSFHYTNTERCSPRIQELECVTVTSTTSLTTSSRSLVCTPDNMDTDSVVLCHSRSTTPSIGSVDLVATTPPLSPLSISPFDFIIPVSPLPPSPVRQIERVSPLSPEHMAESLDGVLEDENATNENEKNVGNVPVVRTPEKQPVLEKLIEYSPIPDIISPIKTPKQLSSKQKKKKLKSVLSESKKDGNSPVKFVSSAPIGVLAVKPKTDTDTSMADNNAEHTFLKNKRISVRELDLRKHVALKKTSDIWSRKESVYKQKDGNSVNKTTVGSDRLSESAIEDERDILSQNIVNPNISDISLNIKSQTDLNSVMSSGSGDGIKVMVESNKVSDGEGMTESGDITPSNQVKTSWDSHTSDVQATQNTTSKILNSDDQISSDKLKSNSVDRNILREKTSESKSDNRKADQCSVTTACKSEKVLRNIRKAVTRSNSKTIVTTGRPIEDSTRMKQDLADRLPDNNTDVTLQSKMDDIDEKGDRSVTEKEAEVLENSKPDIIHAGYDPLMAAKRKSRMAHQPKAHQLVIRKPPVIIEPTVFTQTTRRKRRSEDSSDRNVVPKKQAKGNIFQKRQDDSLMDSTFLENCKKMETFLKSGMTIESLMKDVNACPTGKGQNEFLLELCLECVGRVRTDLLDYVYQSCESGQYLTLTDDLPFLTDVETKTVQLLTHMAQKPKRVMSADSILGMVWEKIFTKDLTVTMTGKMALAKIFTALCLNEGDVEQARVLFYHIASCGYLNHWLFVVPVVSVWPQVLQKCPVSTTDSGQAMVTVFEYIITKSLLSQGTESSRKVLVIMEKLCNWSDNIDGPETVLKTLTTNLLEISSQCDTNTDSTLELMKGFKLLLRHETWAWVKEHFLTRQGLQPAVNRYLGKTGTPSSHYVCAVLEITGWVMSFMSESVPQRDLQHICKTWLMAILSKQEGEPQVQTCCLKTLIEVSVLHPSVITDLHTWFRINRDNPLHEYYNQLEKLRQTYVDKFGLVCEPFVKR